MFWVAITIILSVLFICECVQMCVHHKFKYQDTCCCDTCPYRGECLEVCGGEL